MSFHVPEKQRVRTGPLASPKRAGNHGAFTLTHGAVCFTIIASDGMGWEHVSVHVVGEARCPTWTEMCWIKRQFWNAEDTVVQFHPAKSLQINVHEFTLHLWRCTCAPQPTPHPSLV